MRRRTIKKNFWFNYAEDRQLKKLSSDLNLSESNVIRRLLFETYVKASPPKEFYNAVEKINKIGVNINQLTRIANQTGSIYVQELNRQFKELDYLIKELKEKFI